MRVGDFIFEINYSFSPGRPGRFYRNNGDPGDPPEDPEVEILGGYLVNDDHRRLAPLSQKTIDMLCNDDRVMDTLICDHDSGEDDRADYLYEQKRDQNI
jgi:hypothetical protein